MKAAVLSGPHQLGLQELDKPSLVHDTDALIRVTATMPCTSDVHFVEGMMPPSPPFVIGHEFVGVVEEVGASVTTVKPGDRVIAPSYPFCGACEMCRSGNNGRCPNGALFGSGEGWGGMAGGLAEFVRAPLADSVLLKIPDGVSDERAVFVPDMLASGYFGVVNAGVEPGQSVAVIGAGPVGLCAVHTARLFSPAQTILVGRRTNRLEAGRQMGATEVVDTAQQDPVAEIMRLTDGKGVDAVIDAVGSPDSLKTSAELLRIGGRLSIVGTPPPGDVPVPLMMLAFKNASVRLGMTDQSNMAYLLGLLQDGTLDVDPLITHVMSFDDFDSAFSIFAEKQDNCLKVVLKP